MAKTIKIARDIIKERTHTEATTYKRIITKYTETEEYTARVISERLAIHKHTQGDEPYWYVIHIPTGYVIADVPYSLVSTVKKTFEESDWTLKTDDNGARYLSIVDEPVTWEIYPRIQYTIIKDIQNNE